MTSELVLHLAFDVGHMRAASESEWFTRKERIDKRLRSLPNHGRNLGCAGHHPGGRYDAMKQAGPEFIRFMKPILQVLKDLGGSGTAGEVADKAIELLRIPEQEQQIILKSGQSRPYNQIHWARYYLAQTGYIDSSKRGVWSLTEKGIQADLNKFDQREVFKIARKRYADEKENSKGESFVGASDESPPQTTDYKSDLLALIKGLPAEGFERLCQRLLRESGFHNVLVTGRSGDGGIDGTGILQINPFVSFVVLFQCKKYTEGSVTPSQIRDFRGAMMGRADKGIILTTGTFTTDARKEARRDGAPPIELVAGEDLIKLFENLELGLLPRKTFEVDHRFFDEFSVKPAS